MYTYSEDFKLYRRQRIGLSLLRHNPGSASLAVRNMLPPYTEGERVLRFDVLLGKVKPGQYTLIIPAVMQSNVYWSVDFVIE
ncbi:MAG: hypothetical protein FWF83_02755 [Clostridiales bacterium]|nr:hypothetical protein [Clostridiales bacterium]